MEKIWLTGMRFTVLGFTVQAQTTDDVRPKNPLVQQKLPETFNSVWFNSEKWATAGTRRIHSDKSWNQS